MTAPIVFDLDGVLVDTEPLKARAHRTAVRERGGDLGLDLYRSQMGGPHGEVVRAFLAASDLETGEAAVEAYEASFRRAYRELLTTELRPTDGAETLLAACRAQGRRLALVTSSDPWMVEIVLPRLGGAEGFVAVVTAGDVGRTKPAPDPYLTAVSALTSGARGRGDGDEEDGRSGDRAADREERAGGPSPVAVEDTPSGVAAARAAGLSVVAVRHDLNRTHGFGEADAVVDSLLPVDGFLALVDRLAEPDRRC